MSQSFVFRYSKTLQNEGLDCVRVVVLLWPSASPSRVAELYQERLWRYPTGNCKLNYRSAAREITTEISEALDRAAEPQAVLRPVDRSHPPARDHRGSLECMLNATCQDECDADSSHHALQELSRGDARRQLQTLIAAERLPMRKLAL
eukprot:4539173-Amphidinium_carterae.1